MGQHATIHIKEQTSGTWVPVAGDIGGSLNTFEQAAMGYDPSTGRTPVEQTNNYAMPYLTNGTSTNQVKAAPGFIHSIIISTYGTVTTPTHLVLYDNTAASGTAIVAQLSLPAAGATSTYIIDALFTTGLYLATATVAVATGIPTNAAPAASTTVGVTVTYR